MEITIQRRMSARLATSSTDLVFSTDILAASLNGVSAVSPISPLLITGAAANWPNATLIPMPGRDVPVPGIQLFNAAGDPVPFRIIKIQSAIGINPTAGQTSPLPLTSLANLLPSQVPVYQAEGQQGCRFRAQYGSIPVGDTADPILNPATLNQIGGVNDTFTSLLTTPSSSSGYPISQVDTLTPPATTPPVLAIEVGYQPLFANDLLTLQAAVALLGPPLGSLYALSSSQTSQITIQIDEPYAGFDDSSATDYYLYVPSVLGAAFQYGANNSALAQPNPTLNLLFTNLIGCTGSTGAQIIPLKALAAGNFTLQPTADHDNFASWFNAPTLSADVTFSSDGFITKKSINSLTLKHKPAAVPANGFI